MCFSMTMTINFHFFFSLQDYFIGIGIIIACLCTRATFDNVFRMLNYTIYSIEFFTLGVSLSGCKSVKKVLINITTGKRITMLISFTCSISLKPVKICEAKPKIGNFGWMTNRQACGLKLFSHLHFESKEEWGREKRYLAMNLKWQAKTFVCDFVLWREWFGVVGCHNDDLKVLHSISSTMETFWHCSLPVVHIW